ncbi:MAG: valine--tRNA ligase [Candidatus Aenigmarchaeota archaeon]|nr:valine--tRNA ligase [Candidatus Aenigmarchaeota archaeon]
MLPKKYEPEKAETKWQQFWEDKGIYRFDPDSEKPVYSVDTPPPTLSGKMHIGHAFSYIQQDIVIRFHRMLGKNVFYPFGTDNNGLPTERMVEQEKKVKSSKMERKKFIELCSKVVNEKRPAFIADWKKIGISADFNIVYSTIDEHCRRISQRSFIELYKSGRTYRKRTPFMWCPECQTAIAQVEMKDKEKHSQFVYIKFDTSLGETITIATTRPELMPACVAVHVHPDDKRYKKFIGAKATIPFFGRDVKIYANKDADMSFGSGAVYHCTFGDMEDAKWIEEFGIEPVEIMNKDGTLNEKAGKYRGMKSAEARKAVIKDLEATGRLEKTEPITHIVNTHERCESEIEILMTDQWFIKYTDMKKQFLQNGSELNWYPEHMKNRYDNWVQGLKWDWCISRQRYYGVPFPVWYCKKCGNIILAETEELPVDPLHDKPGKKCKCGSSAFEPEKDVMDTWATSSLTPQLAIELMDKKIRKKLFPMSLRPQGHDIISFWLFNTLVKSQLHYKKNPWKDVMISGWVLDPHGKKMSKSMGNVIDPRDIMKKYPVDAMRYWASSSSLGEDRPFKEKDFVTGVKLMQKIWNASVFVSMNGEKKALEPKTVTDKWIISEMNKTIEEATVAFSEYRFSYATDVAKNFFRQMFCDFYLETAKDRIYNEKNYSKEEIESMRATLYHVLLNSLKMLAPVLSHITEEIYQTYFRKYEKEESIHISQWPKAGVIDKKALETGRKMVTVISAIRKYKTENNMAMNHLLKKVTVSDRSLEPVLKDIQTTMKIGDISIGKAEQIDAEGIKIDVEN